jgi:hypothetical protein
LLEILNSDDELHQEKKQNNNSYLSEGQEYNVRDTSPTTACAYSPYMPSSRKTCNDKEKHDENFGEGSEKLKLTGSSLKLSEYSGNEKNSSKTCEVQSSSINKKTYHHSNFKDLLNIRSTKGRSIKSGIINVNIYGLFLFSFFFFFMFV